MKILKALIGQQEITGHFYIKNKQLYCDGKIVPRNSKITFICLICKKEVTQNWHYNRLYPNFICAGCKRKQTNIRKYGTPYAISSEKVRKTIEKAVKNKYGVKNVFQLEETKQKIKQTNLKKHGVENPLQSEEIKDKIRQTNLKKYGVEWNLSSPTIREKIRQTNLKKYGVEWNLSSPTIRKKIKQTNLKKYGAPTPFESKIIQDKIKQTNIKKYGVENPLQNKEVREKNKQAVMRKYGVDSIFKLPEMRQKIKEKFIEKYGVDNPSKVEAFKEKRKQTMLKRYGVDNYFKITAKKIRKQKFEQIYKEIISSKRVTNAIPLFGLDEYHGRKTELRWRCKKCGTIFLSNIDYGYQPRCPICNPPMISTSNEQKEVARYISSLDFSILENYRKLIPPKEVDIFIPEKNIAIEFDGIYWHSYPNKPKNYHLQKTQECMKKGVRLIHIFEDEWIYKEHIVKARLKAILGKNENIIGARKVIIKEIGAETKNLFLDNYHIQGADRAAIKLGAFYEDKLIGVMTFSKPRLALGQKERKEGYWELSRFATIPNTSTPGLASKMLKYFIKKYKPIQIYSYADIRWNTGKLYDKLGFKFVGTTKPNYWYFDNEGRRYHRFNFRKNIIKEWVENGDKKTEAEIMNELGFFKMYDCGNYKFVNSF